MDKISNVPRTAGEMKSPQEWRATVAENAWGKIVKLFDNDILQKLKKWENFIRDWLEFTVDWEDIIIELLESKYEDTEFGFQLSKLKGIPLEEIKRRIELAAILENYDIMVGYRDFDRLGEIKRTEKLEKWLKEDKEKLPSFRTLTVSGILL